MARRYAVRQRRTPATRLAGGALAALACGPAAADARLPYLGADLSYVNEMEDCGARYRDGDDAVDPYALFAERGARLVRLRLWHDPQWTDYGTLADVIRSSKRAKDAGMQVLLDFHYSDDWADPGDQIVPAAWRELDAEALAAAVYEYTVDVLVELHENGVMPELVQVGNETNTEILLTAPIPEDTPIDWERNVALLNAGIVGVAEAARLTGTAPKTMLHIAQPENVEPWFDAAFAAGIKDFELIGISYYPKWSSRDLSGLERTLRRVTHKYGKDVIVVETAYPWTLDGQDEASNLLGEDAITDDYPATLDGQKRFLLDLTQAVVDSGGLGVVYWEPAWVSTGCSTRWGKGSHWENNTFFDFETTRAHSGFEWLSHDYIEPAVVRFKFDAEPAATEPLYFWASFLEGRDFAVRLTPEQGQYRFSTVLREGEDFAYQLYTSPGLDAALLASDATDGLVAARARREGPVLRHSLKAR
jgi:arabinogalactan endo-1,4-beta-galactosidase